MVFQCMNPVRTNRIDRDMNRLLSSFFGEPPAPARSAKQAAVNVWEEEEAWVVEMELPGVAPEQLDVSVVGNELAISAERTKGGPDGATYLRRERPRTKFSRVLELPAAIDGEKVQARLLHGVLTVTLPKADAVRRRKIEVNTKG